MIGGTGTSLVCGRHWSGRWTTEYQEAGKHSATERFVLQRRKPGSLPSEVTSSVTLSTF